MILTIKAPWERREVSLDDLRLALNAHAGQRACWRCSKYLGSMLSFDFGEKLKVPNFRQIFVEEGEVTFGVRDCYWKISEESNFLIDSDGIDGENSDEFTSIFLNLVIEGVFVRTPEYLDVKFSGDVTLSLDRMNRYNTQDEIAEFILPTGHIYSVDYDGRIYLDGEVSAARFEK